MEAISQPCFNPRPPLLGDHEETQRGFAPLHAPMGGTGEAKLARDAWTLPNPQSASGLPQADWTVIASASVPHYLGIL